MHRSLALAPFALAVLAAFAAAPACSSNSDNPPPPAADAGGDGGDATTAQPDTGIPPGPDANVANCTIPGIGDPVAICSQKATILALHAAFDAKAGVPAYWDPTNGAPFVDGGVPVHDALDDVGYGAVLAAYAEGADVYGDKEITSLVTNDLLAVAALVESELPAPPAAYDGLLYLRLRRFATGLRFFNARSDADKMDALAEAYGRALYTTYFHAFAPPAAPGDAGAGDAAASDAGDDASGDAGASDGAAGDGGGPSFVGDGVLGTPVAGTPGAYAYDVDAAAAGALALIDMAGRAATGGLGSHDDAAVDAAPDTVDATAWSLAGAAVLDHLYTHARHASGLYYARAVASGAASDAPTSDALTTDVQSSVGLAIERAQAYAAHYGLTGIAPYPFEAHAFQLFAAIHQSTPSLWDATDDDATKAACQSLGLTTCGSGFFASYTPSTAALDTKKTARANANLYAALWRGSQGTVALPQVTDVEPLRTLLTWTAGVKDSFLTQFFRQAAYVSALGSTFDFVDADSGAPDPTARLYSAAATLSVLESLDERWVGVKMAPDGFF